MEFCSFCNIEHLVTVEFYKFNKSGHKTCRARVKSTSRKYYLKNKKRMNQNSLAGYYKNLEKRKAKRKERYLTTREESIKSAIQWRTENIDKYRNARNKRKRQRIKQDLLYRLKENYRNRIRKHALGTHKSKKSTELLGCDIESLKNHLTSLFQPGMTWDNYGKWEIDHIRPLSLAKTEEELFSLCHYSNLQPLWMSDNRKKSDKIE